MSIVRARILALAMTLRRRKHSGAPQQPPAAPTGLAAVAGDTVVDLSWNASRDATQYNLKRATVSGGPYTTIAQQAGLTYHDTGLTDGTVYYYVVTAQNRVGESSSSSEVNATPSASTYASDNFNRSDRVLAGDTADIGGNWTADAGTWNILSNQARASVISTFDFAHLDDGHADGVWRLTIKVVTGGGPAIRVSAANQAIYASAVTVGITLFRRTAGVSTNIGSYVGTISANDIIRIDASGSTLNVYQNDVLRIGPVTETQDQTVTKSGMATALTTARFDDYSHGPT